MAAVNSKLREGDKLVAEAEKCLKTSWFKWNPDYDNAAHAFDKAALCYRNAKAYDKARDTYERAADTYYKNHAYSIFHSGKALEQAANVCRDMKALEQAAGFLERASAMYHESGYGDTAGQVLTKAAKLVDQVNPRKAAGYFIATAELHAIEEKYRDSANALKNAVNMYARARDFDKILETSEKLRELYVQLQQHKRLYEVASVEVVTHLHNDDSVAASDAYNGASRVPGFLDSDEAPLLERLIEAYRERDSEVLEQCCNDAVFRSMDTEIAKLARDLTGKFHFGTSPVGASGGVSSEVVKPKSQGKRDPLVKPVSDMRAELFGGSEGRQGRSKKKQVEESEEKEELPRPSEVAEQEQLSDKMGQLGVGEEGGGTGEEEGEDDENAYGGMLR